MTDLNKVPLSLYIHIPWCVKKCPYCDFNSHEIQNTLPKASYIDALIQDVKREAENIRNREIQSIFIGGGTPSIFCADSIKRLMNALRNELKLSSHTEITIEANPGTTDQENFTGFLEAGINRISIGVQSFSNTQLKILGRIHDAHTAIEAVQTAQRAGFNNINVDLMYALPEQTLSSALHDIEQAIALKPMHISYYQLTIEPNTSFYRQPPILPNSQTSWDIQQAGMDVLAKHGYQQYEVSAYAQQGHQCAHNINYWQFGDYLGIGAGAHQKLSLALPNDITRSEKPKHPQQYMKHINEDTSTTETHSLSEQDIIFEFMLNALRLKRGFTQQQFESHTGLSIEKIATPLQAHVNEGLLAKENDRIHCTARGYKFLDDVLQSWLPKSSPEQLQLDSIQVIHAN